MSDCRSERGAMSESMMPEDVPQVLTPLQLSQVVEYVFEQRHAQDAMGRLSKESDKYLPNYVLQTSCVRMKDNVNGPLAMVACPSQCSNVGFIPLSVRKQRMSYKPENTRIMQLTKQYLDSQQAELGDVNVEEPHLGVTEMQVAQKTAHWKMSHPGATLSEAFLFSFAGRLDTSGAFVPGYKCYIIGCDKTTKRKDHMADHIRAHIGEKPFSCSTWYVTD
jgi:hypothetical protein